MRRFYQTQWQGIPFTDFTEVSSKKLADADFYNGFYQEFFSRYSSYNELDAKWLCSKSEVAQWISERVPLGSRVLSVGGGIGYIEYCLHQKQEKKIEIHVQDYAAEALIWLKEKLPLDRIHLVDTPSNESNNTYDMIYLSAVDYALEDPVLIELLASLKHRLSPHGLLLLTSASFLESGRSPLSLARRFKMGLKDLTSLLLSKLNIYKQKGQFWGWQRTQQEYKNLFYKAGYRDLKDGFIETSHQKTYYIEGKV